MIYLDLSYSYNFSNSFLNIFSNGFQAPSYFQITIVFANSFAWFQSIAQFDREFGVHALSLFLFYFFADVQYLFELKFCQRSFDCLFVSSYIFLESACFVSMGQWQDHQTESSTQIETRSQFISIQRMIMIDA